MLVGVRIGSIHNCYPIAYLLERVGLYRFLSRTRGDGRPQQAHNPDRFILLSQPLPAGIFNPLTSLTTLDLRNNIGLTYSPYP